jgi:hypothetical protein
MLDYFQQLQMEIVLGPEMARHNTHIYAIKQLTRNIEFVLPDLHEELVRLVKERFTPQTSDPDNEALPLLDSEWVEVRALDTLLDIVHRLNQHIFVGLPLCERRSVRHALDLISPLNKATMRNGSRLPRAWFLTCPSEAFSCGLARHFSGGVCHPERISTPINYDCIGHSKASWTYSPAQFVLVGRCFDHWSKLRGRLSRLMNGQFVTELQRVLSPPLTQHRRRMIWSHG